MSVAVPDHSRERVPVHEALRDGVAVLAVPDGDQVRVGAESVGAIVADEVGEGEVVRRGDRAGVAECDILRVLVLLALQEADAVEAAVSDPEGVRELRVSVREMRRLGVGPEPERLTVPVAEGVSARVPVSDRVADTQDDQDRERAGLGLPEHVPVPDHPRLWDSVRQRLRVWDDPVALPKDERDSLGLGGLRVAEEVGVWARVGTALAVTVCEIVGESVREGDCDAVPLSVVVVFGEGDPVGLGSCVGLRVALGDGVRNDLGEFVTETVVERVDALGLVVGLPVGVPWGVGVRVPEWLVLREVDGDAVFRVLRLGEAVQGCVEEGD